MTDYRLFPSTDGPPSPISYPTGSPYIAGIQFKVTQGGMWFTGYWWWVCATGQTTAATKCALWSVGFPNGSGTLVPGSVVTSGTLTAGQWNYIPLPVPIQLAPGSDYCAAIAVNGSFPSTPNQFGSGQPYAAGVVNGPLSAYSDQSGSLPAPYGHVQGVFTVGGSDPETNIPMSGNSPSTSDNNWVDVQVSDTPPAGFSGSRRLWPNKYDASDVTTIDQAATFVLATEFHLSQSCLADSIGFFSLSTAASLPTWAGIYRISDQALVASVTSPAWVKPDGTAASAGAGAVKCALPGGALLPPGAYKAAVYNAGGASGGWSPREYGYWNAGAGSAGIVNGPLSAPSAADASTAYLYRNNPASVPPFTDGSTEAANGTFANTGPQYPYLAVDYLAPGSSDPAGAVAENFWVDVEVTPVAETPPPGLLMAGII